MELLETPMRSARCPIDIPLFSRSSLINEPSISTKNPPRSAYTKGGFPSMNRSSRVSKDIQFIPCLVYTVLFSTRPIFVLAPTTSGVALRALDNIFRSQACSSENVSRLTKAFIINTIRFLLATMSNEH